jgi:hypothetical protein
MNKQNFWQRVFSKRSPTLPQSNAENNKSKPDIPISPGRVSVEEDYGTMYTLRGLTKIVEPSFRVEVIQLIRDLYKVNPDVGIALQDMFKLANTKHTVTFPSNTDAEAEKMRNHLRDATKKWSLYTAGIDGLVNKMIVQLLVSGAISVEGVPDDKLEGLATVLFLKPENIVFKRETNGVYKPFQKNMGVWDKIKKDLIELNPETYFYACMFNDTDEPYGIPPFMPALDSIKGQHDMKENFKHIMEVVGMIGFLEAKIQKPDQQANESIRAYEARLRKNLVDLKKNLREGMKDGIVTGYIDDHEFNLNSTTKELGNINEPWNLNQQSVANGLGVNGAIIGVNSQNTEGGTGIMLSKMISQLKNIQMIVGYILDKLYSLELRLAGFNNKGIRITWGTSTISDEVKVQQGLQYKIQNLDLLYAAGIISQEQYAWEMGYDTADEDEPRVPLGYGGNSDPQEGTKKKQRQDDKNQSARRSRDKNNPNPSRGDQNTKAR